MAKDGIRAASATFFAILALIAATLFAEASVLAPYSVLAPLPAPLQELIKAVSASPVFWILFASALCAHLTYRTYKTFTVFAGLKEIKQELAQAAAQRERLDEAVRASAIRQENFEESTRADDKRVRELFYLLMILRPKIEEKLAVAKHNHGRALAGDDLTGAAYLEMEASLDYVETAMFRLAGRAPETADIPKFKGKSTDENLRPTREATKYLYAGKVRRYEYWLEWIDRRQNEFGVQMHDWVAYDIADPRPS